MKLRALPIFWQTLLLIVASLLVAQLVTIALFVTGPKPTPDFVPLGELADTLRGGRQHRGDPGRLAIRLSPAPPRPEPGMVSDPALTARLSDMIDRPVAEVRLFYEADQSATFWYRRSVESTAVPTRRGEPFFFNTVVAAARLPEGAWRIVRSPDKPWLTQWQQRSIAWFGLSLLLALPLAYLFTRRLTRPIRRFSEAVARLDHDPQSPPIPVEGPAELRLTASALNAMQQRLHAYLRERTAMVGAIAHDLRTPLARITFRIEGAPEPLRSQVQGDVEQMRAMVAATMAFLRTAPGVGVREPVALGDVLRTIAAHSREMGTAVDDAAVGEGTGQVLGDRGALERVFQNLVDNGVKYAGTPLELALRRAGGRVIAEVSDRGPGAPPDRLERLFEPFERGDPSRSRATGGLGLGLAIARGIVVAHGGTIRAENRAGGGLRFTVDLPAA